MTQPLNIAIVGGGAAGIFASLRLASLNPTANIFIFEKSLQPLSKVKISGGGRCNVTHNCFIPKELINRYPRGSKQLLGPFHTFQPQDTIDWFLERGVLLKIEADGRMFPTTNSSQTIIDCFLKEIEKMGVNLMLKHKVIAIEKSESQFKLSFSDGRCQLFDKLLLATGSSPEGHQWAASLGHKIVSSVPSLFTFNVPNSPLKELSGVSLESVKIELVNSEYQTEGPLLITHFGFSGPAVLRLSAWGARIFHEQNYNSKVRINWLNSWKNPLEELIQYKVRNPKLTLLGANPFRLPKSLWKKFLELESLDFDKPISHLADKTLSKLIERLTKDIYTLDGKTTHKEEFVTAGGIALDEINFKTMESKVCPQLFFAGEIMDIDGITGGFNFQNAWTTGWIAGSTMAATL